MAFSSGRWGRPAMLATLILGGAFACTSEVDFPPLGEASGGSTVASSSSSVLGSTASASETASGLGGASLRPPCGVTTLASGLVFPSTMALHGDTLYVTTLDQQGDAPGTGRVVSVPLAGGAPVVLASGQGEARGIAADDSFVYWTSSDGTVKKTPVGGGPIAVMAGDSGIPERHRRRRHQPLCWK